MDKTTSGNSFRKRLSLGRLSIQQRLPFFICVLLLTIILTFSWVSYIGVKKASLAIGAERVTNLVEQLSKSFKESINNFGVITKVVAQDKNIKVFLQSGGKSDEQTARDVLDKFVKKDTLSKSVLLLDTTRKILLSAGNQGISQTVNIDSLIPRSAEQLKKNSVGKIILYAKSMYYPVILPVKDKSKTIGYLINWRVLKATQKSVDQLAQILGANGKLYFGNDDEKFWTDLLKPVPRPPVDSKALQHVAEYSRKDGDVLIGSVRRIENSRWLVLVEFSESAVMETAHLFLKWVIIIGVILVVVGSLGGWIMSRNITTPLYKLTEAASAIAEGNYAATVDINREDELGRLAKSFNMMAIQVRNAQLDLEKKVQERTRELESAKIDINDQKENEKKKDEFISIASHELKTPLTTIKAFFQLAKREINPEFRSYGFISKAGRQLNRMERLIEDLLDVSKINSGKMQYNLEQFEFSAILRDAVDSVQEISPTHTLVLEHVPTVMFNGDRHRLEQVIINLLNNAVKYSPDADKVIVNAELSDESLVVTIKDFGIGVSQEHLEALFERFYRVDTQHRFQGLGLGLFISSDIIKRHGGRIWAESVEGQGSVFKFQLPLSKTAELNIIQNTLA
jgi:signal transduction histidine kinase